MTGHERYAAYCKQMELLRLCWLVLECGESPEAALAQACATLGVTTQYALDSARPLLDGKGVRDTLRSGRW